MRRIRLPLLVAALLLAGCSSPPDSGGALDVESDQEAIAGRTMQPLRNSLAAPVEQVHWANGSVPATNACNPVGCAMGESTWQRVVDLTPALPVGAPVQLELELTYAPHPVFGLAFQVQLEAPEAVLYAHSKLDDSGRSSVVATLLPRGTLQAVVYNFQPSAQGTETESSYALRIRVVASPDLVPAGVPVAARLAGGDTLRVGLPDEGRAFILFRPDGARVGAFAGEATLDAAAPAGEYAVLLTPGGPAALSSDNGDTLVRPLGLRHEVSPPATVAQSGAMEESWEVTGLPVGAGLRIFTTPVAAGLAPFISSDLTARLTGPNGFVLDSGTQYGYITFGELGDELSWMSALGDERVSAGTYTVHTESTATYEAHVEAFAVYIDPA